ncbi:MAG: hypothetical protein J0I77_00125 [Rudaea sp.]|uniref:hypothetical protein n=1 Tax=unclassified Rudaea TaxID=2627037 RepID=UPI0010F67CAC|nr:MULTISPECIES: hypothetical protein [unclassified Rudaea]MBN8884098.1 hypothetical protein [Rudaea sp.]
MKSDAIIEVRFKTTAEGGRRSDVVGSYYGCPLFVGGEAFDCRLPLEEGVLHLGKSYRLPVKFMNPNLVLPKLSPGVSIALWEGKEVAVGRVISITTG